MQKVTATILAGLLATPLAAEEITVAMHYTEEQAAPLIACFRAYEGARPDTTVAYQQLSYRDYLQTVLTGRLAGQAADVYNLYSIWGAQMVDNGVLAEPPADLVQWVRDGYSQGTVEAASIDGTLWGVPTEVSLYMLVSNMELLREAGYDAPPATWEELREIAQAVTTRNDQGRIDRAGFALADSSTGAGLVHPYYAMLFSKGGAPYEEGYTGTNFADAASVEAVEAMAGLTRDGLTDRSVDAYDFPAGGIGMMIMANWYESAIRDGLGDMSKVAVSPIPMGEDWKTLQYAFLMGVDSGSQVKDEAWDLIRYVNGEESANDEGMSCMGEMLLSLGALTANASDLAAMGEPSDFLAPYVSALEEDRAVTQPNVLQAAEIEAMIAESIDRVLAGEAEAASEMEALDGEVSDILSEFY